MAMLFGIGAVLTSIIVATRWPLALGIVPIAMLAIGLAIPGMSTSQRGMARAGLILGSLALLGVITLYGVSQFVGRRCGNGDGFPFNNPLCSQLESQNE